MLPKRGRPPAWRATNQPSEMPTQGGQRKSLSQILAESKAKKEERLKREAEQATVAGNGSTSMGGPSTSETSTGEDVVMTDVSAVPGPTDDTDSPVQSDPDSMRRLGIAKATVQPTIEKLHAPSQPPGSVNETSSALPTKPPSDSISPELHETSSRDQAAKLKEQLGSRGWKVAAQATTAAESQGRINALGWKPRIDGQGITATGPSAQMETEETSVAQRILSRTEAAQNLERLKSLNWKLVT